MLPRLARLLLCWRLRRLGWSRHPKSLAERRADKHTGYATDAAVCDDIVSLGVLNSGTHRRFLRRVVARGRRRGRMRHGRRGRRRRVGACRLCGRRIAYARVDVELWRAHAQLLRVEGRGRGSGRRGHPFLWVRRRPFTISARRCCLFCLPLRREVAACGHPSCARLKLGRRACTHALG